MSQAEYAALYLSITRVCFTKLSLVAFLRDHTPLSFDRKFGPIIGILVIVARLKAANSKKVILILFIMARVW